MFRLLAVVFLVVSGCHKGLGADLSAEEDDLLVVS